jgi:orotate phosphoribosyltransferase
VRIFKYNYDMDKEQIAQIVKANALEYGDFTLASGAKSKFYLDCKKITLLSEGIYPITYAFLAALKGVQFDAIGGPTLGADPIVGALLFLYRLRADETPKRGFLIRDKAKDHGKDGLIVGSVKPGDKVVVIEDTTTSGASLMRAADTMVSFGCTVVKALSIVDREAGAADLFAAKKIPFDSLIKLTDLSL